MEVLVLESIYSQFFGSDNEFFKNFFLNIKKKIKIKKTAIFIFVFGVIPHLFTRKYLYQIIWFLLDISNLTINFLKIFFPKFLSQKNTKNTKFFFFLDIVPNLFLWEY